MASRRHLIAINRAIRAAGLDEGGVDAALVELLRDLARRIDATGSQGTPVGLVSAYLSAQKDLRRAHAINTRRNAGEPAPKAAEKPLSEENVTPSGALERLRAQKRTR